MMKKEKKQRSEFVNENFAKLSGYLSESSSTKTTFAILFSKNSSLNLINLCDIVFSFENEIKEIFRIIFGSTPLKY